MGPQEKFRVFVFSKTAAYRHDSIPAGIEALRQLGASSGAFAVEASEDASLIDTTSLSRFKVVLFLSTSGEFLTAAQLGGLRAYVNGGGGFVGVHGAAAGMRSAPWYGELVGAYFAGHAAPRRGVVAVEGGGHAIASGLPDTAFEWFDEWYDFARNPRHCGATVLLSAAAAGPSTPPWGISTPPSGTASS
ncbi:putative glycosyl hydrolase [Rosellinia necatrix]|uniref:Putative glycosyl hydrolase n=1 Tax=Rosellinia necatrix TaxID=77044 RepID=A0A1W2TXA9_ROSNE|nr:putative glycosyl hydrolase [Rosellinia necatrix]